MTRPTKQPTAGRTVNLDYAANPPVFYANFSHVHMTPFDCQLVFGDITEANQAGINAKVTVRIAMSPEHAGVLLANLNDQMNAYVQRFGKLRRVGPDAPPGFEHLFHESVSDTGMARSKK